MEQLITPKECYIQNSCKKYNQNSCTDTFCIRLYKINELYNYSLLPLVQRQDIKLILDTDRVDEVPYTKLYEFSKDILTFISDGTNLFICSSNSGNGKTSWAIKFIQAYIRKIWATSDLTCKALFINVPRYIRELKLNIDKEQEYVQHINEYVLKADLVVWDDIAVKSMTKFEHEQLLSIIDSRIGNKKCNIFTSNILSSELNNCLGARLTSRILGTSYVIQFNGKDKRGYKE